MKSNKERIVEYILECKAGQPKSSGRWTVDKEGNPFFGPGIGGITLNIQVGDPAFGWEGDHIEPSVSATANAKEPFKFPNNSFQFLACTGNEAEIISGEAKGSKGYVIGHHGGSEHVIIEFTREVKEKMTYDDKIIVKSKGQGLKLLDFEEIKLFNLDPDLLDKMPIQENNEGELEVGVTTKIPAACMGSGVGSTAVARGDYDVMTSDKETVKKYNLDKMRFGDFVAILDHDNSYGRAFRKGSVTIGIVVHSDCILSGHGPGITTLMTCKSDKLKPIINEKANISNILETETKFKKEK